MGIVLIIIIPCSFHDFKKTLPLPWYSTVKGAFNHPRYGRVYNYKQYLIIGSHNNWIIMNLIDDGTDK